MPRSPLADRPARASGVSVLVAALGLSAALWTALPARVAAAADDPGTGETAAGEALGGLSSPFLAERREAAARLVEMGASARAAVLSALRGARPPARDHLVEVLGEDGSPEATAALLDLLPTADPAAATAIRRALLRHPTEVSKALDARLARTSPAPRRLLDLRDLLRRARVEAAFLSRKSTSGGTGYYRGQFEVLLPDREAALPILLAILADRPFKVPGEHPIGGYAFLARTPPGSDRQQLREMAANALSEHLRPTDDDAVASLARLYREYLDILRESFDEEPQDRPPEASLVGSILPTLHRLDPVAWDGEVATLLAIYGIRSRSIDEQAMLLLRVGRYEDAIAYYELVAASGRSAYAYYNIACAYATWSVEEPARAPTLRVRALRHLRLAIDSGYLDWPWMEQDRDLDSIRDTAEYRRLLARIQQEFLPPSPPTR